VWAWKSHTTLSARLVLLILVPLRRGPDSPVERIDRWAFLTTLTLAEIGIALGKFDKLNGDIGLLMGDGVPPRPEAIPLDLFDVSLTLSRDQAARLSGYAGPVDTAIAAVGCGALGSQVFLNAYRSGFGKWTLIDHDHLLPHNLARHALPVGQGAPKALALSAMVDELFDGDPGPDAIVGDVLNPGARAEHLQRAFREAGLILDMSTSVPVARILARDTAAETRRASLFLNPRGTDLVLLMEDAARTVRLDALEMQYYRAVLAHDELVGHITGPEGELRYGRSCRDVTFVLSQEVVAMHAGLGSQALRRALANTEPRIQLWQADPDSGAVAARSYRTHAVRELAIGEWQVVVDDGLLKKLMQFRARRLPNETGGVLLGSLDLQRRIAYIVDALPSPPDSTEYPTCYIRGSRGLLRTVEGTASVSARACRMRSTNAASARCDSPAFRRYSRMVLGNRGSCFELRGVCCAVMPSHDSEPKKNRIEGVRLESVDRLGITECTRTR